jgi:hypothetical protein
VRGQHERTAEALGVERSNLYRKMKAFGILSARKRDGDPSSADEAADGMCLCGPGEPGSAEPQTPKVFTAAAQHPAIWVMLGG